MTCRFSPMSCGFFSGAAIRAMLNLPVTADGHG